MPSVGVIRGEADETGEEDIFARYHIAVPLPWNEFLLAQLFLTDGSMRTVSAGLLAFTSQYTTNYTLLNAGIVLTILPVIAVYLVFQRYFVSGLAGAIKG